eukprot:1122273-Lingulodinium_polyedra.AAC.1
MVPGYERAALGTQCGGIAGRGADVCQHMGRAFWEMAEADARPAAALYLDLAAAFASVARDLLCTAG